MESSPAKGSFRIFRDDCNKCIHNIVKEIPAGSLTVAFIDPEALHIHFEDNSRVGTFDRAKPDYRQPGFANS